MAEWDRVPLVPVTVTVNDPLEEDVQERVEVPEPPVTLVSVRMQVRPDDGDTEAARATVPANPVTGAIVMLEVPVAPTLRLTLVGPALIVKS